MLSAVQVIRGKISIGQSLLICFLTYWGLDCKCRDPVWGTSPQLSEDMVQSIRDSRGNPARVPVAQEHDGCENQQDGKHDGDEDGEGVVCSCIRRR